MLAVMFGGACAGLAGAYLPLAYTPFFIPGMTAGRGWIALALVVFASWRPGRLVIGAYLFGAVTILQLHAQGCGHRHSLAIHVGAALSRDRHRAGADLARANRRLDRAGRARHRVRAGPLISYSGACAMGRRVPDRSLPRLYWRLTMRKTLLAAAAAASARRAALGAASAADKLKVGFIYLGPVGDLGWTYQHEVGRQALVKELGDKIETTYLENVREGPDAERSIEQLVRAGNKLIFTTSFGYMDPTLKVAKKYPERAFRARHRLQARQEHVDLFGRFYEGRYIQGMIAGQDVEDRRARLYRLVPDSGGHLGHQRHDARRADGQSEHQGQDHLGQHLVRSRARKPTPPRRCSTRAPTSSCSTPISRPRCRSPPSAASSPSARTPT